MSRLPGELQGLGKRQGPARLHPQPDAGTMGASNDCVVGVC